MKKDIHSDNYRKVIFLDTSSGEKVLIGSTVASEEVDTWTDGKEYPVHRVEISSASHPFYTGKEKVLDTAGRVERFQARRKAAVKTTTKAESIPTDSKQTSSESSDTSAQEA